MIRVVLQDLLAEKSRPIVLYIQILTTGSIFGDVLVCIVSTISNNWKYSPPLTSGARWRKLAANMVCMRPENFVVRYEYFDS